MKNRLIIFDCFGVIFGEIAPIFFGRHFPKETAITLKEKFFVPADLGLVTSDELFDNMAKELGMKKDDIIEEWESLIRLNKDIVPIIEELGKTADIALLSNAPIGFVERIFDEHNLTGLFDRIFVSSNLKMAKPDPAIYTYCVKQFGKNYDEIYMIDDNIANLEPLEKIGIIPIHYKNIDSLNVLKST